MSNTTFTKFTWSPEPQRSKPGKWDVLLEVISVMIPGGDGILLEQEMSEKQVDVIRAYFYSKNANFLSRKIRQELRKKNCYISVRTTPVEGNSGLFNVWIGVKSKRILQEIPNV